MNVPSRVSTFTAGIVTMLSLLITLMGSSVKAADETVFFHVDALGSATAAFNEAGDLCWKQYYTPYGEQTNNSDASPPVGCGLIGKDRGFTGHTQDESGLTYMQQRYYDPTIGRFLSVDPVGVNAAVTTTYNRYMYANNNPYLFVDPDGRAAFPLAVVAPAVVKGADIYFTIQDLHNAYDTGGTGGLAAAVAINSALNVVPGLKSATKLYSKSRFGKIGKKIDDGAMSGSVGASRVWTKKGRLKAIGLPTTGKIRFVPRKGYDSSNPLPRGPNNGILDRFGNEWTKGPSRTQGQAFEWDVQLSKTGKQKLGWATRDGSHANVSLDGHITHR